MAYLFDTDAISEVLRSRPLPTYLEWLGSVPRAEQFASAVSVGELFRGAYRSPARERHLRNVRERVLSAVTVLPFDAEVAQVFGEICARLERDGQRLADADVQIAATAVRHRLVLVTGNVRHFGRVPGLEIEQVLAEAKNSSHP